MEQIYIDFLNICNEKLKNTIYKCSYQYDKEADRLDIRIVARDKVLADVIIQNYGIPEFDVCILTDRQLCVYYSSSSQINARKYFSMLISDVTFLHGNIIVTTFFIGKHSSKTINNIEFDGPLKRLSRNTLTHIIARRKDEVVRID